MRFSVVCVLAFAPCLAMAQGSREGDIPFDQSDLSARFSGQVATFYDNSTARYTSDGRYAYIYAPGDPPFLGVYEVTEDSQICVKFENGFERCDAYVENGGRLVLITETGLRFPVKSLAPLE